MTDVNTLNERTRLEKIHKETGDRLAALLIAVYRIPLEQRTLVLEQYERNLKNIRRGRKPSPKTDAVIRDAETCETCGGDGLIEIMGDGANFEWDVIGHKPCPDCAWEDPIQD